MPQHPTGRIDDSLASELERITLKCLAKRASDRYTTAADLAEDLRAFRKGKDNTAQPPAKVVPKGLRSFDARDSQSVGNVAAAGTSETSKETSAKPYSHWSANPATHIV